MKCLLCIFLVGPGNEKFVFHQAPVAFGIRICHFSYSRSRKFRVILTIDSSYDTTYYLLGKGIGVVELLLFYYGKARTETQLPFLCLAESLFRLRRIPKLAT